MNTITPNTFRRAWTLALFSTLSVGAWAQTAPEEAAKFVSTLPAGKGQENAAQSVLSTWAGVDPSSAGAWPSWP